MLCFLCHHWFITFFNIACEDILVCVCVRVCLCTGVSVYGCVCAGTYSPGQRSGAEQAPTPPLLAVPKYQNGNREM